MRRVAGLARRANLYSDGIVRRALNGPVRCRRRSYGVPTFPPDGLTLRELASISRSHGVEKRRQAAVRVKQLRPRRRPGPSHARPALPRPCPGLLHVSPLSFGRRLAIVRIGLASSPDPSPPSVANGLATAYPFSLLPS